MIRRLTPRSRIVLDYSLHSARCLFPRRASTTTGGNPLDQRLRILFCGSEQFSAYSLRALADYARSGDSNIDSIDVVTRKDKHVGRGLKRIKSPVLKAVAEELTLPLHQIDTFTGWSPPTYDVEGNASCTINLIIAVSFGLLVPPRILSGATYGGLNVHPSLLPQFKGAAPIHWTILRGLTDAGVTLQTLHESKFDEGAILDRVLVPVENPLNCSFAQLRDQLGPVGAELLVKGIREKLYLSRDRLLTDSVSDSVSYAPKFGKAHGAINPDLHSALQIHRMRRAFHRLWAFARTIDGKEVRLTTDTIFLPAPGTQRMGAPLKVWRAGDGSTYVPIGSTSQFAGSIPVGVPYGIVSKGTQPQHADKTPLLLNTVEGSLVIPTLTISGTAPGYGFATAARQKCLSYSKTLASNDGTEWDIYTFNAPIRGDDGCLPAIVSEFD